MRLVLTIYLILGACWSLFLLGITIKRHLTRGTNVEGGGVLFWIVTAVVMVVVWPWGVWYARRMK